jgi:lambda repressor-like predicted transcriptional regulator
MAKSDLATARLHRDWLRKLPAITGKSLTSIAEQAGIARSTLTRPLKKADRGISTLNARSIERVIAAFGVPAPGTPADGRAARRMLAEDAVPYEAARGDPLREAVAVLIAGRNNITTWTLRTRALELLGFLEGDVVLVDLSQDQPQPGQAVCAQIYDWPRLKAETVMRIYERAGGVELLLACTLDATLRTPLQVDGERVVIKGVLLPHRLRP